MPIPISINLAAVFVAALAYFLAGWLWFSPILFGNLWMKEMKIDPSKGKKEEMKKKMLRSMVLGFVFALIMSYVLAHFALFMNVTTMPAAAQLAGWLWLGFMLPVYMGDFLWEGKSMTVVAIGAAHDLVGMVIMAMILAAWSA